VILTINDLAGQYKGPNPGRVFTPKLLEFTADEKIHSEISLAKSAHSLACDDIEVQYKIFTDYGRSVSAEHKLHPEAYIQVALQLAYYRMHGKAAPTYCTASTRNFYHGRTETCRSCFSENVEFAKAVTEGSKTVRIKLVPDDNKDLFY
jgi:carnitine O-octanoyltransferase